jgi:hypothetical protein
MSGRSGGVRLSGISAAIATLLVMGSCDPKEGDKKGSKHEHQPPHAGTLVEFGEECAHLELILDAETGQLTGYVLDGEAEKPLRLEQMEIVIRVKGKPAEFNVPLKAVGNPLTAEKPGDTSQFEGQSDLLRGLKAFDAVVLKISVKGKEFSDVSFNFPKGNEEK